MTHTYTAAEVLTWPLAEDATALRAAYETPADLLMSERGHAQIEGMALVWCEEYGCPLPRVVDAVDVLTATLYTDYQAGII